MIPSRRKRSPMFAKPSQTIVNGRQRSQTIANGRKRSQTVANDRKWSQTVANDRKWSQTIANGRKRSQTIADGRKRSQTVANDRKWSQTIANGRKRSQIVANRRKRPQMVTNDHKRWQAVANNRKWSQRIANGWQTKYSLGLKAYWPRPATLAQHLTDIGSVSACNRRQTSYYSKQTQNICITFVQRRPNVFDALWYRNVLCFLGWTQPSKHEALNQCWIDAGPASQTVGQHWTSIWSTLCLLGV